MATKPEPNAVRAMSVGRDLDALVHTYVAGKPCVWDGGYFNFPDGSSCGANLVPHYSDDWSDFGPLLEKCPHQWEIGNDPGGWGEVIIFRAKPDHDEADDPFNRHRVKFAYDGKTLPWAGCVALVLAALEGWR